MMSKSTSSPKPTPPVSDHSDPGGNWPSKTTKPSGDGRGNGKPKDSSNA